MDAVDVRPFGVSLGAFHVKYEFLAINLGNLILLLFIKEEGVTTYLVVQRVHKGALLVVVGIQERRAVRIEDVIGRAEDFGGGVVIQVGVYRGGPFLMEGRSGAVHIPHTEDEFARCGLLHGRQGTIGFHGVLGT